jgi:molybdopterin synthase catalytic subunit
MLAKKTEDLRPKFEDRKSEDFCELTFEPLDVGAIARRVVFETCGATVTLDGYVRRFTGTRETLYLEYEGYEPMAFVKWKS